MADVIKRYYKISLYCTIFILTILFADCKRKESSGIADNDKRVEVAEMFNISHIGEATIVEIYNSDKKSIRQRLILLPRRSTLPADLPEGIILRTPLEKVVIFSDVYAEVLNELGNSDIVKGVADSKYYSSDFILKGLRNGTITDIGNSSSPSAEKIIGMQPDAILITAYEGMDTKGIEKLNVPVIYLCDNLEQKPVGRAEWIKLFGLLCDKQQEAESIFSDVKGKYTAIVKENLNSNSDKKPKVLTELMYQGIWYVPGGESYQAQLLNDAGAQYPWSQTKSNGSLSLSFEEVLNNAQDADLWLIRSFQPPTTVKDLLSYDSRYKNFKAIRHGLYICDTSKIDIFKLTAFHPEKILREYKMIFADKKDSLAYFKNIK